MNFFKKLFSKNKSKDVSVFKDESEDEDDSAQGLVPLAIDFGDNKAYPYFMRYEHHDLSEGQLASVFHYAQDEKPVVLQTVVLQDDEGLALMDNSEMSEEMLDSIDKQAKVNISEYELEFQFHPEYNQEIIVAQGPLFTCETILSEEQMLKAHVMLDADEIMIAIPRRGVILAASNDLQGDMRQTFMNLHMYIWLDQKGDDGKLSQICKDIFVLKHGEIQGVLYIDA